MGDWSAFRVLDDLSFAPEALVAGLETPYPCGGDPESVEAYLERPLVLTKFGRTVLRGEAEPETDGREGLKSLEVLVAAYMSARDGKRVALPLEY